MARIGLAVVLTLSLVLALRVDEAQPARIYRVGLILEGGPYSTAVDGLRDGLKELGFEEGRQFVLQVRDVRGDPTAVAPVARRFEEERIDLIYVVGTSVTLAVKQATKRVPIVFYAGADPVALGLVESFRKPGGRLTGIHGEFFDTTAKRLELLKEMIPKLRRVLTFYNPDNIVAQRSLTIARDAARQLQMEIVARPVASVEELRAGLRAVRPGEADAFVLVSDAMVVSQAELILDAARAKSLPTMLPFGSAANGALASYGESYYELARHSAKYVHRILLGADPGDLPVEQLDRVHFVINLKTAKALGLTIPQTLLLRADQVIE